MYRDLHNTEFGVQTNKPYLIRRVAYKLQENVYGAISAAAKNRLNEYMKEYDPINNISQNRNKSVATENGTKHDRRIPVPGTTISKQYKGNEYNVKVLEKGFEYKNVQYKSLSAIAKKITGSHWNGYVFFNL